MFYHAYNSYLHYAFPLDELKPLSCGGNLFCTLLFSNKSFENIILDLFESGRRIIVGGRWCRTGGPGIAVLRLWLHLSNIESIALEIRGVRVIFAMVSSAFSISEGKQFV